MRSEFVKCFRLATLLGVLGLSAAAPAEPLIGPAVGNPDLLATDGARLYNKKQYAKAAETVQKAVRADPSRVATYLLLARSYLGAKDFRRSCTAYKAYLKAAPASSDSRKAQSELEGCEKKLRR